MTRKLMAAMLLTAGLGLSGCGRQQALFNGRDLDGWRPYLVDNTVDPASVWSVRDGVLRCEGTPLGYLRTTQEYSNYRLHLEWRWPEVPTNSGVLLHTQAPDQVWPLCIEAQLKSGHAGDLVTMGQRSRITVEGEVYQTPPDKIAWAIPKQHPNSENPVGQWNSYDIICSEDTIRLYVNGVLQNTGTRASVKRGSIGLQSEGSPIEFRNIYLEPIR
jgi:hypothetical protein